MNLSSIQIAVVVSAGILFWFLAAICVRYLGPWAFDFGFRHLVLYALILPGAWVGVRVIQHFAKLEGHEVFTGVTVATMAALFLDGLAFVWLPSLYGLEFGLQIAGAASILWGAGAFIAAP